MYQDETAALIHWFCVSFHLFRLKQNYFLELVSAATGVDYSIDGYLKCGERIWNLERLFNVRAGLSRKDDTLPDRFFEDGGIDKAEFEKALDEYYRLRGWMRMVCAGGKAGYIGLSVKPTRSAGTSSRMTRKLQVLDTKTQSIMDSAFSKKNLAICQFYFLMILIIIVKLRISSL